MEGGDWLNGGRGVCLDFGVDPLGFFLFGLGLFGATASGGT